MNTMACLKCGREFEIGYWNTTMHVYREEIFLRWAGVSCACGQDYQLFTDSETDKAMTRAGILRVVHQRPTPEVQGTFDRMCHLKLKEEYEKEVAWMTTELEGLRAEGL